MTESEQSPGTPDSTLASAPAVPALPPPLGEAAPGEVAPVPNGSPATGRPSRLSRGAVLALGVGVGAAAVGACWLSVSLLGGDGSEAGNPAGVFSLGDPKNSGPFSTDGTLTLTDVGLGLGEGDLCSGTGGYSDIDFGAQVNVTDADGTLVAVGSLGFGEKTEAGCVFPFTVDDIPPGSKFYTVEVSHRGGLTQTEDELREGGLDFTLGD